MEIIPGLLIKAALQVWTTFLHNWIFLLVSVIIAVGLKLFINPVKVSAFLLRYRKAGVVGATAAAVATPFCSCGTGAVLLGMMASMIPWAPIIAFMVASPLTSPEELIYSAGLFGWPFALAFFVSSILLGLTGGMIGDFLERRGWLANQSRFAAAPAAAHDRVPQPLAPAAQFAARPSLINRPRPAAAPALIASAGLAGEALLSQNTCCGAPAVTLPEPCGCDAQPAGPLGMVGASCDCDTPQASAAQPAVTPRLVLAEVFDTGKRLLAMFLGFAFIGYVINGLIPSSWVASFFGEGNIYSVPLAATLGLPLYINSEASLPLVRALIDGGMSQGAAMAFLITGAGTSIGALAGALTIARWRVIATVVATLWIGAIAMGYIYNSLLVSGIF